MKKNYTDITFILDRSGSMSGKEAAVKSGFKEFIDKQRELPGKATISVFQFDDIYEAIYENMDLENITGLDDYKPRNMTALNDAIGKTITSKGTYYSSLKPLDRPEKVILVIVTDGMENASKEFTGEQVKQMVEHQQAKYNWEILYIGSNQDAVFTGVSMGADMSHCHTIHDGIAGYATAFGQISANATLFRTGTTKSMAFTDEQRKKQEELMNKLGNG